MTWFKLDDKGYFHRKVVAAGNEAYGAWCRAGQWSSDHREDGFISTDVAHIMARPIVWERLIRVGLLEPSPRGGYVIHDFLEYNPSATEVKDRRLSLREQRSLAGKASAAKRARQRAVEPPLNGPSTSPSESRSTSFEQKVNPVPIPIPIPIQKEKENPPPWAGGPGGPSAAPDTATAEAPTPESSPTHLPDVGVPGPMTAVIAVEREATKATFSDEVDPWGLTPPQEPVKRQPGVKKTGHRLLPDWEPSSSTVERFKSREQVDALGSLERFKNFWLSKSGAQAVKVDWERTFVNWVLEDIARGRATPWAPPPAPKAAPPAPEPEEPRATPEQAKAMQQAILEQLDAIGAEMITPWEREFREVFQ